MNVTSISIINNIYNSFTLNRVEYFPIKNAQINNVILNANAGEMYGMLLKLARTYKGLFSKEDSEALIRLIGNIQESGSSKN